MEILIKLEQNVFCTEMFCVSIECLKPNLQITKCPVIGAVKSRASAVSAQHSDVLRSASPIATQFVSPRLVKQIPGFAQNTLKYNMLSVERGLLVLRPD